MPNNFVITAEGSKWRDCSPKQLILGKKNAGHGQVNGEIDFYPVEDVRSNIAVALMDGDDEQKGNIRDLRKSSSALGALLRNNNVMKGTLRMISEAELNQILQAQ